MKLLECLSKLLGDADIAHNEQPRGETEENENRGEIPDGGANDALVILRAVRRHSLIQPGYAK